jgi:hypothetical protein
MLIIKVQNTTDLAPVSDYRYEVLVNLEVIASGEVKGHVRADGWAELVRRVIEPYLPANSVMVTWIKPEDRLPDDDQDVVYCLRSGEIGTGYYDSRQRIFMFGYEGCIGSDVEDVLFWMPVPPVPIPQTCRHS